MDRLYVNIFSEISHAISLTAAQLIQSDKKIDVDEHAVTVMHEDYDKLYELLKDRNFNPVNLERTDYIKLLVGAIIVAKNLEQKIETETKALNGYKTDTIPKLERILNETENSEEARQLAYELFNKIRKAEEKIGATVSKLEDIKMNKFSFSFQ